MLFNDDNSLDFKVHVKPNVKIKYVNSTLQNAKSVIEEVPRGVMERLTKLTIMNERRLNMKINELYLEHIKSLRSAGFIKGETPTFKKFIKRMEDPDRIERKREREK